MKTLPCILLWMVLHCVGDNCDAAPSKGTASTGGHAAVSAEDFRKIVSAPADTTPLVPQLAKIRPLWTNAIATISLKYQNGKTFNEEMVRTAKTVQGKYIVFTIFSKLYGHTIDSIFTYDENVSAYKTFGLFGENVVGEVTVYDFEKRIYATSSVYGGGYSELGIGSFSDSLDSGKNFTYKDGVLLITREVKVTPK